MYTTVSAVLSKVRWVLGDTETSNGILWTDAKLATPFALAYPELVQAAETIQTQALRDEAFLYVAPYTSAVDPSTQQIYAGRVDRIWACTASSAATLPTVSAVTISGTTLRLTFLSDHGLSDGNQIALAGFSGYERPINDVWPVKVYSSTQVDLLGLKPVVYGSQVIGTAYKFSGDWNEVCPIDSAVGLTTPADSLRQVAYQQGIFYLPVVTQAQFMLLDYYISATPPTSGTIPIANCESYLVHRTAYWAAAGKNSKKAEIERASSEDALEKLSRQWVLEGQNDPGHLAAYNPRTGRRWLWPFLN